MITTSGCVWVHKKSVKIWESTVGTADEAFEELEELEELGEEALEMANE